MRPSAGTWGWRTLAAQALTLLPPLATLGLPLLWAALSWDQLQGESATELLGLSLRSLVLALAAAGITVAAALLLSIARRWLPSPLLQRLSFAAGMGYAVPGAVLALALMLIGGPLALSPCSCCSGATATAFWRWPRGARCRPRAPAPQRR